MIEHLTSFYAAHYLKTVQITMLKHGIRLTPREEEEIELAYQAGYHKGKADGEKTKPASND